MSIQTGNRLESRLGNVTLQGRPHALSALFVVLLRVVLGGMILFAGLGKIAVVPGGQAFDALGYLANIPAASPVSGLYGAMAANPTLVEVINVLIPATQVLIGVGLIIGGLVRLAAFGGALQMLAFYLGGWEGQWLGLFDSTLVYAVVFLALGALAAGRILGADARIEQLTVGGQPLIERYPRLRFLLGEEPRPRHSNGPDITLFRPHPLPQECAVVTPFPDAVPSGRIVSWGKPAPAPDELMAT